MLQLNVAMVPLKKSAYVICRHLPPFQWGKKFRCWINESGCILRWSI